MPDKSVIDKLLLKNAIRLAIGGYLNDGGEIFNIPDILEEMKYDYKTTMAATIKEFNSNAK